MKKIMSHSLQLISKCPELRKHTTPLDNDSHLLLQLPVEIWTTFILPNLGVRESRDLLQTCRTLHCLVCQSLEGIWKASLYWKTPDQKNSILPLPPVDSARGRLILFHRATWALSLVDPFAGPPGSPHCLQDQQKLFPRLELQALKQLRRRINAQAPLLYLTAQNSGLTTIPDALSHFPGLLICNFQHNLISFIRPNVLKCLPNITLINLSENLLQTLHPNTFSGAPMLRNIDLSRNDLSSLPSNVFSGLPQLDSIDLSHNRVTTLPPGIFANLPHLRFLYLHNNPWENFPLPEGTEYRGFDPQEIDLAQCSSAFRSLFEPSTG